MNLFQSVDNARVADLSQYVCDLVPKQRRWVRETLGKRVHLICVRSLRARVVIAIYDYHSLCLYLFTYTCLLLRLSVHICIENSYRLFAALVPQRKHRAVALEQRQRAIEKLLAEFCDGLLLRGRRRIDGHVQRGVLRLFSDVIVRSSVTTCGDGCGYYYSTD